MGYWQTETLSEKKLKISKSDKKLGEIKLFREISDPKAVVKPEKVVYKENEGLWYFKDSGKFCDSWVGIEWKKWFGLKTERSMILFFKNGVLKSHKHTVHYNASTSYSETYEFPDE